MTAVAFTILTKKSLPTTVGNRFNTVQIPLADFISQDGLSLVATRSLVINGPLKINDTLTLAPSVQPTTADRGQIYYDKNNDQLEYYDGSKFVSLASNTSVVQNVGGLTGQLTVGNGLSTANGQLSNSGVLSVQGQTGAINFTAGPGIAVNGTTLGNTGVTSVGGQTGDITIGNGLNAAGGVLQNTGVLSATGGAGIAVTDDGAGNITISNSGTGSGTVQSPGGTTGKIAKFTGVQTIADSLLSEAGSVVTVGGDLAVANGLTLGSALTVANGGTGAVTLTANGILIGQGTGAVTTANAGSAGQCLVSTAGAPVFSSCPGSGGITGSGTTGAIAKFTGSGAIGNSLLSEAGSVITVTGSLSVTSGLTLGTPLTVPNGGTGAATLANNGVLIGQGAGAITAAATGTSGQCLLSTAGAPAFGACPGSGSVTGAGTTGTIAKFTGSGAIGDSLLSEAASLVTVNGSLSVTNGLTLGAALTVTNGGTGAASLTANGVVIGQGTGALTTVTTVTSGQCLVSTAGAPAFATCPGAGSITGSGTTGTIAKFTGSGAIGNSLLSESGSTITAGGSLSVTNGLTLGTALTVANGGTGATSLATNGVVIGQGTGALTTATTVTSGQCLVSTAGAPAFATCPGSGGVTGSGTIGTLAKFTASGAIGDSLLSESGATLTDNGNLNLTTGHTYQINGADICTSSGCTAAAGSNNYVQLQGGTPGTQQTGNLNISGTAIASIMQAATIDTATAVALNIGTTNATAINLNQNTSIANDKSFTAHGLALFKSNTNSTIALQVQNSAGSSTLFNVDTQNGLVGVGAASAADKLEVNGGSLAVYNSGANPKIKVGDSTSQLGYMQWDSTNHYLRLETTSVNGLKINDNNVAIGNVTPDQPLKVAIGSTLLFQVNSTGAVQAKNSSDSTTAFQVLNSTSVPQFVVDTSNSRTYIGNPTPDATGALLVLDTKNTSGDPTGIAGAMYYNSSLGMFRCYAIDHWQDCLESGRTDFHYRNDLINTGSDTVVAPFTNGTGAVINGGAVAGVANHPGIGQMDTGTTSTGLAMYGTNDSNGTTVLLGNGDTWRYTSDFRINTLSNSTDRFTFRSGMIDASSDTDGTYACFIKYSDNINSGKWQGVCNTNGSITTCNSTLAPVAAAWTRVDVVVTGALADFQINGTSVCTVSTNIPTTAGQATTFETSIIKSVGTAHRTVDLDYIEILGQFANSR